MVGKSKTVRGSTFLLNYWGFYVSTVTLLKYKKQYQRLSILKNFGNLLDISISTSQNQSQDKSAVSIETLSHSIEDILAESIDLTYPESGFALSVQQKMM